MVFSPQILGVLPTLAPAHGLAALVVALALMTGCGQKGPLFIATPPTAPAATVNPASASTASAPAASASR